MPAVEVSGQNGIFIDDLYEERFILSWLCGSFFEILAIVAGRSDILSQILRDICGNVRSIHLVHYGQSTYVGMRFILIRETKWIISIGRRYDHLTEFVIVCGVVIGGFLWRWEPTTNSNCAAFFFFFRDTEQTKRGNVKIDSFSHTDNLINNKAYNGSICSLWSLCSMRDKLMLTFARM